MLAFDDMSGVRRGLKNDDVSNFTNKTSLANKWMSFSSSNLALVFGLGPYFLFKSILAHCCLLV